MKINEKRLMKVWCRLDNRARYLDELMVNKNISDDMFKVWYLERDRLSLILLELAIVCGYPDTDMFKRHIIDDNLGIWDSETKRWVI